MSDTSDSTYKTDEDASFGIYNARLPFIENQGQISSESIRYYAKTFAGTVYVTEHDLTYHSIKKENNSAKSLVVKEKFLGNLLRPEGTGQNQAVVSYFKGTPRDWKTDIPTFDTVFLGTVWENIDVHLNAHGNNVEKIFTVRPGGRVSDIRIIFDGIVGLSLAENDELVVDTELGSITLSKPIAYQQIDGKKQDVFASYEIINSNTYGFSVLSYDPRYEIVIDPLIASTFIGGSADDTGWDLAFDGAGSVYVVGSTFDDTVDLPTTAGAYSTTHGGFYDVFVAKFNTILSSLSAATFIGGDDVDEGFAIALDSSSNVYISGFTSDGTIDFPTTAGAFSTTHSGGLDVFVAKFNGALTSLLASTLVGGDGMDFGEDITLDSSGNVYITGETADGTIDFPTTAGAFSTTHSGGPNDVFVAKFNGALTSLLASTLVGGDDAEASYAVVLDSLGNIYITGETKDGTIDFPTTAGAFSTTHSGGWDVFVAKFNNVLTSLLASTFIGGDSDDYSGYSIALDSQNNVYISGYTSDGTTDFPTTAGAFSTTYNGGMHDAFVAKFNGALTSLLASTLVGGDGIDFGFAIALDSLGNVYVTGNSTDGTIDFPTTAGAFSTTHSGFSDAFVAKFNNALTSLLASTFIGGTAPDAANIIFVDNSGNIYITGLTYSTDYPVSTGAFDITHNGVSDVFVSVLDCNLSAGGSTCGTVTTGGSVSIPVASGGTAEIDLPSGNKLSVTLPAGVSDTITIADTDAGNSDANLSFLGSIVDINADCAGGCTISFTFTGADAAAAGFQPSQVTVYHDSNENGSFEAGEALATTISGTDPFTATASASFTSKFAIGGIRANAVAAANSLASGGFFNALSSCDPDGFGSGVSLKVYSISYDRCTSNKLQILAYSTCGPIISEVTTKNGRYTLGISSNQPFLSEQEKKIVFGADISQELESFSIVIKDKRDSFMDKITLNQCNSTKTYIHDTRYTSEQQSSLLPNVFTADEVMVNPSIVNNLVIDPEPSAMIDPEPSAVIDPEPSAMIDPEPSAVIDPEPSAMIDPEPTSKKPMINLVEILIRTFSKMFYLQS